MTFGEAGFSIRLRKPDSPKGMAEAIASDMAIIL